MTLYKVKPGCVIYHNNEVFNEGEELELTPSQALVHAPNITVISQGLSVISEENGEENEELRIKNEEI